MVRAELGAGERERAQNLFRRMEARYALRFKILEGLDLN